MVFSCGMMLTPSPTIMPRGKTALPHFTPTEAIITGFSVSDLYCCLFPAIVIVRGMEALDQDREVPGTSALSRDRFSP